LQTVLLGDPTAISGITRITITYRHFGDGSKLSDTRVIETGAVR